MGMTPADDISIRVGLPTAGKPRLRPRPDGTHLLENLLIGKDFHWQQEICAILPGEISLNPDPEFPLLCTLPLETYLECVAGSEMNPNSPIEFLRAHAIISRSWALGKILRCHPEGRLGALDKPGILVGWDDTAAHKGFHVCSDDHCQRFQGLQPIPEPTRRAIADTAGIIIASRDGQLVDARFSKCCGGTTELFSTCWQDIRMPGIESIDDPWCNLSNMTDRARSHILNSVLKTYDLSTDGGYRWHAVTTKTEISQRLMARFNRNIGEIQTLTPIDRGPSGRIKLLRLTGTEGELLIGKELWIRRLLAPTHLYSSAIEIKEEKNRIQLTGSGWGHGVGLCQIGAARMAHEGATAEEILAHYYPDTHLHHHTLLHHPDP